MGLMPACQPLTLTHPCGQVAGGDGEPHGPLLVVQEGEGAAEAGVLAAPVPLHPEEAQQGDEDPAEAQPQVAQHVHGEHQREAPRELRRQPGQVDAQQRRRRLRIPPGGPRARPQPRGRLRRRRRRGPGAAHGLWAAARPPSPREAAARAEALAEEGGRGGRARAGSAEAAPRISLSLARALPPLRR